MIVLAVLSFGLALLPALLFLRNVRQFRPPPDVRSTPEPIPISVLIPARNEEQSIGATLDAILASEGVELEVFVLDDASTDSTADIVRSIAARDTRVHLEAAPPLPQGWSGKQFACFTLAQLARQPRFCFLDADVRLAPTALVRLACFQDSSRADLVSGFPRQETGTFLERLLIPLIHWLVVCYLPLDRMRTSPQPGLGTGCGQWFLTTRAAYDQVGGHEAVKSSFHDGIQLPRAYRRAGFRTDICDGTPLATCRMYHSAAQVWNGLAKNAREGLGGPILIWVWTILLLGGHVLPWVVLGLDLGSSPASWIAFGAMACSMFTRLGCAWIYCQSRLGAWFHPLSIVLLIAIQWYAALRQVIGRPVNWKGRQQPNAR